MICRTFFCLDCYKNGRPKSGDTIVVYKKTTNVLVVGVLGYNVHKIDQGFTPHLIEVVKRQNNLVVVEVMCGVHKCGVFLQKKGKEFEVLYYTDKKKTITLSEESYNTLLARSDYGYRLDI